MNSTDQANNNENAASVSTDPLSVDKDFANTMTDEHYAENMSVTKEKKAKKNDNWFVSLLIALLLALGIRHFLVQAYKIPSGSMIPTLLIGDQLIASKVSYGIRLPFMTTKLVQFQIPKRGEIVVFKFPDDPSKDFIKRTIGLPGERIRIENGDIYIDDELYNREFVKDFSYPSAAGVVNARMYQEASDNCSYNVIYAKGGYHSLWNMDEIKLTDDEIFVMGDNRDHSNDSRFWGPVNLNLLEGKPLVIHFSWFSEKNSIRWDRAGTGLLCDN